MLEIQKLTAKTDGKVILNELDLTVKPGEIHAIMGPNGAGKSTLAKVLAGHPFYEVVSGKILFQGKDLLELDPEERAHAGLFMSFQYPLEIPGVSNEQFLYHAHQANAKARGKKELLQDEFGKLLDEKMALLGIPESFKTRNLNEGFSGGEKKRNEILQMAVLEPSFAILDETDSGLDIDALKSVAKGIQTIKTDEMSLVLITHYQRLLDLVKPDHVHVMVEGKIVRSGGFEIVDSLEEKGYQELLVND